MFSLKRQILPPRFKKETDLINPRLVNNISGMGSVAQGAEGLVIAAGGGRDGCNTSRGKEKKKQTEQQNIAFLS